MSNKTFKRLASKGKTSTGWFFGLKLHLVINEKGELLAFQLTGGNVHDLAPVDFLAKKLFGHLFGDKGYCVLQEAVLEMEEWPSAIDF